VEIMSPHYTQIRDGNTVTIPPGQRRRGDLPGALRIARRAGARSAAGRAAG
jgi:hypothetical protein